MLCCAMLSYALRGYARMQCYSESLLYYINNIIVL